MKADIETANKFELLKFLQCSEKKNIFKKDALFSNA